jgi:hypothetical protein
MVKPKFDSFVILAGMRTGSNYLEANLNAVAGVKCYGEVFNPAFIGKKDQVEMFGQTLAAREADPLVLLRKLREATTGLSGFRFFHDHDPRILAAVLADSACAKIILTRNPLESYVSLRIARETGQWKLGDGKALKTARVRFDPKGFDVYLEQAQYFAGEVTRSLQHSGQTAFHLDYADLQDLQVLNGLLRFLGVSGQLDAPDAALKKQNPAPLADKVTNPAEMEAALARLDPFGITHLHSFEPQRSAGIPSFLAVDDASLLFMPMRGGSDDVIAKWLADLAPVSGDFNQKALRQWKRSHLGHCSFTVVRHPVARAFAAFRDCVLSGEMPELRGILARSYKVELPVAGDAFDNAPARRTAFLGFLRFLKLNLGGQTGFRVDARWASQSAVLQGFAQFQSPDHVLHEDRLAEGLAYLARDRGVKCPSAKTPAMPDLAAIYDAEVEAATRDAYTRDYMAFGFGDWRV